MFRSSESPKRVLNKRPARLCGGGESEGRTDQWRGLAAKQNRNSCTLEWSFAALGVEAHKTLWPNALHSPVPEP